MFPLVEADAVATGLPDASFDIAISEYGASIWCDPYLWIPEAYRLLRPGGRLVFLRNSTLVILCSPDTDDPATTSLQRPQCGMHRFTWPDSGIEFHLGARGLDPAPPRHGFDVVDLVELLRPRRRGDTSALRLCDRRVGAAVAG